MKTRKPKILYEQLPVAEEPVTKVMRKGKPDEYTELLVKAKTDTGIMVDRAIEKAKDEQRKRAARIYVPKLFKILIKYDYKPADAKVIVTNDCEEIWSKSHVIRFMPKKFKDQSKVKGGKISGKIRRKKAKAKVEEFVKEHQDKLPGLASASEETRKAVSKLGGETLSKLYGPEHFSDMGKKGMESRWHSQQQQQTFQIHIETEEHRELVQAFEKSLIARANGTGGYVIFATKDGYDRVEPDLNGRPENTVNK